MFCKYCGKKLPDKAKFCSKCGKQLSVKDSLKNEDFSESQQSLESDENEIQKSLKFCKFCGEKISAAAKFCPKCGRNLVIKSEQKTEETNKSNTIIAKEVFQTEKITEPIAKTEPFVEEEKVVHSEESPQTTNTAVSEEKFTVKNLFAQVFKKHTAKERDEVLKAGLASEEESKKVKICPENLQPWFYSRVFLILLAVFAAFEIGLVSFENSNMMPGIMLMGSVMIPFSLLTMYFELNVYKDISFYKVIGIFLLGGAVSLLFTLFLYEIIPTASDYDFWGAALISIIEEVGKAVVVIFLLKKTKNATVLQGLLIGGAIGCGFAVFESAGYAFNVFLNVHDYNTRVDMVNDYLPWYYQYGYADSIDEMNFNIFLRSILSFGGHTAWAAITGAAFSKENKVNIDFIKAFAVCFVLHALWDFNTPAVYFKYVCLCLVAWWVIIRQISNFVEENKQSRENKGENHVL